jgi:nucleotide-binding universal stress UspA family protein
LTGTPHDQILTYAETNDIDLIVICTRGQSGFLSRWLMGSVSDRVVRGARVPVLVVRATNPSAEPG